MTSEDRVFWLSFADEGKFLGGCVVVVTPVMKMEADELLKVQFPNASPGAGWITAAVREAHVQGCNPGGQVLCADVTGKPEPARYPVNTLLSAADLKAYEVKH